MGDFKWNVVLLAARTHFNSVSIKSLYDTYDNMRPHIMLRLCIFALFNDQIAPKAVKFRNPSSYNSNSVSALTYF